MDKRKDLISDLVEDYADYLEDYDLKELSFIAKSGRFTLREAQIDDEIIKEQEQKERKIADRLGDMPDTDIYRG